MSTKRIVRWIVVLFLLAALPGMTAVLAQEQEPAQQAQAVSVNCNLNESEPNDGLATADVIGLGDVVCGELEYLGITDCVSDFFRFNMPMDGYAMLTLDRFGASFHSNGLELWLGDSNGNTVGGIDWDADGFLLQSLPSGDYYVGVYVGGSGDEVCTSYALTLSSPLLVSAAAGNLGTGTVAGIPFLSEDILAHADLNNGEEQWKLLFDGSDVGITKNVTNIATAGGDRLALTLATNQTLPGVGAVTPWDIVIFDPEDWGYGYGEQTSGTFVMSMPGQYNGLTTSSEKLDAIDWDIDHPDHWYDYAVSTTGVATATAWSNNLKADDEDVFGLYEDWGGAMVWYRFFDVNGVNDGPAPGTVRGLPGEDVFAMAYNDTTDVMYLTILGSGKIAGHNVTQKDIFAINYPAYTWGGIVWHGPDHGWNYNIDAIELNGW